MFFLQRFYTNLSRKALFEVVKPLLDHCELCLESKHDTSKDRGLVGALPIPTLANNIVYVDSIQMDDCDNHNYVLTIVDGLSKFVKFVPCSEIFLGKRP